MPLGLTVSPAGGSTPPLTLSRRKRTEAYYDLLDRFRGWCDEHGVPFQVGMREAICRYMGELPSIPPRTSKRQGWARAKKGKDV